MRSSRERHLVRCRIAGGVFLVAIGGLAQSVYAEEDESFAMKMKGLIVLSEGPDCPEGWTDVTGRLGRGFFGADVPQGRSDGRHGHDGGDHLAGGPGHHWHRMDGGHGHYSGLRLCEVEPRSIEEQ